MSATANPPPPPQMTEMTKRIGIVKQMVQHAMLPALRERFPDMADGNLMEVLCVVAVSGVTSLGSVEMALSMVRLQVLALEELALEQKQ